MRWRRGLKSRKGDATALQFGTWIHEALECWRNDPRQNSAFYFCAAIARTQTINTELGMKLDAMRDMGIALLHAYQHQFGSEYCQVYGTEVPLDTPLVLGKNDLHMKLDLVFRDAQGLIWIKDYKTTKTWNLDHLIMDDQTSAYLVFAEQALKAAGYLTRKERICGMQYDFLRKGQVDDRPRNALGQALNTDGSVSKRQGSPLIQRVPIIRTRDSLARARARLGLEFQALYNATKLVRQVGPDIGNVISKNPGFMCASTCEFFQVCRAHEEGIDITEMVKADFKRSDPYDY
jgi:hypothetical protein